MNVWNDRSRSELLLSASGFPYSASFYSAGSAELAAEAKDERLERMQQVLDR